MKVIILAAGRGSRLKPLTDNKPKCLIKLFGKSLLEWQIEKFRKIGIRDISVVAGFKKELISIDGIKIYHNTNFEKTNMIETLFCAEKEINETVIVSYGDIIFQDDIVQKLIESKEDFSVVIDKDWKKYWDIRFDNPLNDAESLILDSENYIKNIGQKTTTLDEIEGQYIGLMMFKGNSTKIIKNFYKKMKKLSKTNENPLNSNLPFELSYMTDFLQGLINEKNKLKAVLIKNGWLELDSIQDYEIYNKLYKEGTISNFLNIENS
jgi:choline kinase|tara:strand:+ start:952 stop:1746 length:795 start_codon:yes stop_codon:yes gene_type:complete